MGAQGFSPALSWTVSRGFSHGGACGRRRTADSSLRSEWQPESTRKMPYGSSAGAGIRGVLRLGRFALAQDDNSQRASTDTRNLKLET